MDVIKLNLLGAYLSVFALTVCIFVFVSRLAEKKSIEHWLGIVFIGTIIPYVYLLFNAQKNDRPGIYYIQLMCVILFLIVELLLDYIFKLEFRNIRWMVITYVMLFFAATGGMIGIASNGGKLWTIISVILFFIMTALAFIQRSITGM